MESKNNPTSPAATTAHLAGVQPRYACRDQIVLDHLPLVKAIAVRLHKHLPMHVDMDDLVQAGVLGLFDAATKFNSAKHVPFPFYAKYRIRGEILDSLRKVDRASRSLRWRSKKVEAATRELSLMLGRLPTELEVAEKVDIDVKRLRYMMIELRHADLISASIPSTDHDGLPAADFPSDPVTQPDNICAYHQMRAVLGRAMEALPKRQQKIVSMYYTNEMTMKEIGGLLGINESSVSQIHKRALWKMHSVLQKSGISSAQCF